MPTLDEDVAFFNGMLQELIVEEQELDELHRKIQVGFKKSLVRVNINEERSDTTNEQLPANLLSELETALSRARIAYESYQSKAKSHPHSKQPACDPPPQTKPVHPPKVAASNDTPKRQPSVGRKFKPAHTTAPYNTFKERPQNRRPLSGVTMLRRKAKSWVSGSPRNNSASQTTQKCPQDHSPPDSTSCPVKVIKESTFVPTSSGSRKPEEKPSNSCRYELHLTADERVRDIISLSKSLKTYAEEAQISSGDPTPRLRFQEYCESIGNSNEFDLSRAQRYLEANLPEVISLFENFSQILDVIDWNVATEGQWLWRNQMLENFLAIFDIAEYFKPRLLGNVDECGGVPELAASGSSPKIETIWKAYVCSGGQRQSPSSSEPPVIPSRSFCLTHGPAVLVKDNSAQRDLLDMVDMWRDIFHLQRQLRQLEYIEKRLPDWLQMIAEQQSEKASTLRLLCSIACGCLPVTLQKD
uniref:Protein kinase domain-containing protein n=1 Tax=Mesocestoides corti TaxID=53468 RepID=A0A5K3G3K8_MESCO